LLKDAPVLVMDEAVANLDAESELALREAIAQVVRDRTTLLIAHRPSTIRTADRIVVLDSGRVVEVGSFDELMTRGEHLARLLAPGAAVVEDYDADGNAIGFGGGSSNTTKRGRSLPRSAGIRRREEP
ncbi:MAG: hypothetical protein ACRDGK_02525, partial [Actinomycetota bacterium]